MKTNKKIKNYSEASVKNDWDPSILIITDSACGVNEISETIFLLCSILHPFVFPVKKTGPMKNTFIYEYHRFPSGPVKLPSPLSV